MYETVIFDLDGTLLDTLSDLTDAVNAALRKNGVKERSQAEVRNFIGNGIKNLVKRALGKENESLLDIALEDFKAYYALHCADKTKPYEGVISLLQRLKEKGISVGIVSNKADFAVKALTKVYFENLISVAIGENEEAGIRKKPAPDSVFAAMEELGGKKSTCVYVGDSEVDIQTAKNAGVDCISVTWGFKDKDFLVEQGGTCFADTPMEILQLL